MNSLTLLLCLNISINNMVIYDDNLLENGSFEVPLGEKWNPSIVAGVSVYVDDNISYTGKKSLRIENIDHENKAFYGCNHRIPAPSPGNWLTLSSAIKVKNFKGRVGMAVHYFDDSGKSMSIRDADVSLRFDDETHDWRIHHLDFVIHEGTKEIRVALYIQGQGTVWFDNLSLRIIRANNSVNTFPSNGAFLVRANNPIIWFEYAEKKVFYRTPLPGNKKNKITVYSAKNEWESFQLVIKPEKEIHNCQLEFSELWNSSGTEKIPEEVFLYYTVGYIDIKITTAPDWIPGKHPDFLVAKTSFNLAPEVNNPIWIEIFISDNVETGIYSGEIKLKNNGKIFAKVPLEITVWDFTLPESSHLYVRSNFWLSLVKKYDNRSTTNILEDYYENMRMHRVNALSIIPLETKIHNNRVICSFDKFDRRVRELFDTHGFEAITVGPFLGDASGWNFRRKWMGIDPESSQFESLLKQYCKQLEEHLHIQGWLDQCWVQYWDEPRLNDPDFEKIVKVGSIIKKTAPNLKIFMTTRPIPSLFDVVDIWCIPFNNHIFDQQEVKRRQYLGEKVFIYHNDPFIDTPLIDKRIYGWRYRLADIDGVYSWWNLTYWENDPYKKSTMVQKGKSGKKVYLKAGDGVLLYPNSDGAGPPVNSLRWEIFRQGLEDYEYFWLLENKLGRVLKQLKVHDIFSDYANYRVQEIIRFVVRDYFGKWNRDVSCLYDIRQKIAQEILEVEKKPLILVKAILQERSITAKEVEVYGITEIGTMVFVNNHQVDVDSIGFFDFKTSISEDRYFEIRACLGKNTKTIKRFFKRKIQE